MTGIEAFILARVAEDESLAMRCMRFGVTAPGETLSQRIELPYPEDDVARALADHFDPDRVLADCAAKRALVALYEYWDGDANDYGQMEGVMVILARIWSDHPDFDPAWGQA